MQNEKEMDNKVKDFDPTLEGLTIRQLWVVQTEGRRILGGFAEKKEATEFAKQASDYRKANQTNLFNHA